jgi:hypothetical protein
MMTTVFIAGSRNIKNLHEKVKERINNIVSSQYDIVVGDASGADSSIQEHLREQGAKNVIVYCTGPQPRNNIGGWSICSIKSDAPSGSRAFFTEKDIKMAQVADYGLMIWDTKSTGTLSNAIELLKQKKKSLIFINKNKEFKTISDVTHLESLVSLMSEHSISKANEKISLFDNIIKLKNEQFKMFD